MAPIVVDSGTPADDADPPAEDPVMTPPSVEKLAGGMVWSVTVVGRIFAVDEAYVIRVSYSAVLGGIPVTKLEQVASELFPRWVASLNNVNLMPVTDAVFTPSVTVPVQCRSP